MQLSHLYETFLLNVFLIFEIIFTLKILIIFNFFR